MVAAVLFALMALPAPVAMAQSDAAQGAAGLLPSLPATLPSPCVGGVVLCGDGTLKNPAPCVAGVCVPTPCVQGQVLCGSNIIGSVVPSISPTLDPGPTGTPGTPNPPTATPSGPGTVAQAPLVAPPGVGIVPPISTAGTISGPAPASLASLLTLSIGDGLAPGGAHLWPWLAGLQGVLLLGVLGALAVRRLTGSAASGS